MSFIHAPTILSLAIGAWLTLIDLLVRQSHDLANDLGRWDTVKSTSGQTVLQTLEAMRLVDVRRYEDGSVERVILRASQSLVLDALLELGRRQCAAYLQGPRPITRMKLVVPRFYGDPPFVPSRN